MNNLIKEKYISLTRAYNFKLPDALIAATALVFEMPLITSDKGFQKIAEINLVSYQRGINLTRGTDKS